MTNKDKYAKEILSVALEHDVVAVTCKERIVMGCSQMEDCRGCLFYGSDTSSCKQLFKKWANAEYKEPKQFTEADKAYVKAMDKLNWFAKDEDGNVWGFVDKPFKKYCYWHAKNIKFVLFKSFASSATFESLSWEDEEPTSREEILEE